MTEIEEIISNALVGTKYWLRRVEFRDEDILAFIQEDEALSALSSAGDLPPGLLESMRLHPSDSSKALAGRSAWSQ